MPPEWLEAAALLGTDLIGVNDDRNKTLIDVLRRQCQCEVAFNFQQSDLLARLNTIGFAA